MTDDLRRIHRLAPLGPRDEEGHKGSFGRLGIVAGSRGMLGAAILCARAALRSGVGSVVCSLPEDQQDAFTVAVPAAMTTTRADGQELDEVDAFVVGPGLGRSSETLALIRSLASGSVRPMALDADGLNAIAPLREPLWSSDRVRVLTPHPGEAARLLGTTVGKLQADRESAVLELARRASGVVVLKGPRTLVCDGEQLYVNRSGNDGLATAGSGDVLAGVLGALLAGGIGGFDAACHAVDLHGRAGDLVADELSRHGLCAEDLPLAVARVWKDHE